MSGGVILVAGLPRSGTTWVAEVLGGRIGHEVCNEPDNEGLHPLAWVHKRGHRFTGPEEFDDSGLELIFRRAADGWIRDPRRRLGELVIDRLRWSLEPEIARRCGHVEAGSWPGDAPTTPPAWTPVARRLLGAAMPVVPGVSTARLVKTVHAVRVIDRVAPIVGGPVVVVVRNPFAVLASMRRTAMVRSWAQPVVNPDRWRNLPPGSMPGDDIGQVAFLYGELHRQVVQHPEWMVVAHDELCREPIAGFDELSGRCGLDRTAVRVRLAATIGDGAGHDTRRSDLPSQIDRWRGELDESDVLAFERRLGDPIRTWFDGLGASGHR